MGWKTVIIGADCTVSLTMNNMRITWGNDYQTIPLCDIDTVLFSHDKVVITIPLLSKLVENNINVVICDSKNDPVGVFHPFNNHSLAFKKLQKQLQWKLTRKKKLWKFIIEQKIQSEIDILELLKSPIDTKLLKEYQANVCSGDQSNREAAAARNYFMNLFGKHFKREDFTPLNAALNYGYKIFSSHISKCIISRGLLPQLGIHHIGESNPFNLTYDFIEVFRAIVDAWVVIHIEDHFHIAHKRDLIELIEARIFVNGKWISVKDGIEDIVDSYISFLNEELKEPLKIDLSKGIKFYEDA